MISTTNSAIRSMGRAIVLSLGVSSILSLGCGGSDVKGLIPVKGRVTLDGGPWPREGTVSLVPVDAKGADSRPVVAKFDPQGNFEASAFDGQPGIYPGSYKVGVACLDGEPGMDAQGKPTGKNIVPEKYQSPSTSGFTLDVKAGATPETVFDVKSR